MLLDTSDAAAIFHQSPRRYSYQLSVSESPLTKHQKQVRQRYEKGWNAMSEMLRMQGKVGEVSWTVKLSANTATSLLEALVNTLASAPIHAHAGTHTRSHTPESACVQDSSTKPININPNGFTFMSPSNPDGFERSVDSVVESVPSGEEEMTGGSLAAAARLVINHYADTWFERIGAVKHTKQRVGYVTRQLRQGYTVEDLRKAITGYRYSRFHIGDNDRFTKYRGLKLFVGNADRIDRGIELYESMLRSDGTLPEPPSTDDKAVIESSVERFADAELRRLVIDLETKWAEKHDHSYQRVAQRFAYWEPMAKLVDKYDTATLTIALRTALAKDIPNPKFVSGECVRRLKLSEKPARDLSEADKAQIAEQKRVEAYRKMGIEPPPLTATG